MPMISCTNCGKSFERSLSQIKRAKHSFCSPECQKLWSRKAETRVCDWCGKPVIRQPSQFKGKHIFCNRECHRNWRKGKLFYVPTAERREKISKTILAQPELRKKRSERMRSLCNQRKGKTWEEMFGFEKAKTMKLAAAERFRKNVLETGKHAHALEANPNWRGGLSFEPYGPGFNSEIKEIIRKRDGYLCQLCGMTQKSHIQKYKMRLPIHHIDFNKRNNDSSNLVALCKECHCKTNWNRGYYQRLLSKDQSNIKIFHQLCLPDF